jgi:hypothetical protein
MKQIKIIVLISVLIFNTSVLATNYDDREEVIRDIFDEQIDEHTCAIVSLYSQNKILKT